ncbi:MAG: class I SAM-dependent methyltransferase [Deltaproteobacteria bacterium]|nr:class I SAM-dependent methyltransferase [Deltaproteobacteria bacterium]
MKTTLFKIRGYLPLLTVRTAVKLLEDYSGRIIDVGCGKGALIREIRDLNDKSILGIDIRLSQAADAKAEGMPVVIGDIIHTPFRRGAFDIAVCLNTIYNFPSLQEFTPVFKEIASITKESGKIMIDIRNKANPLIRIKTWIHNRRRGFPAIPYVPEQVIAAMKAHDCKLVGCNAVGVDNRYLAWGYILVFEKENSNA